MFGGPHDEKEANVKGRGVFISGVRGNSVAAANTQIQLGMQIVAMNDVDLTQATFVELRELLQSVGDKMTLVLRENLELIKPYRKADYRGKAMRSTVKKKKVTVDVKLTKVPGGGFGCVQHLLVIISKYHRSQLCYLPTSVLSLEVHVALRKRTNPVTASSFLEQRLDLSQINALIFVWDGKL